MRKTETKRISILVGVDYREHIEINPNIRFGKACLVGTRISVYDVLGWLAAGMTKDEIIDEYSAVTEEKILACLAYLALK